MTWAVAATPSPACTRLQTALFKPSRESLRSRPRPRPELPPETVRLQRHQRQERVQAKLRRDRILLGLPVPRERRHRAQLLHCLLRRALLPRCRRVRRLVRLSGILECWRWLLCRSCWQWCEHCIVHWNVTTAGISCDIFNQCELCSDIGASNVYKWVARFVSQNGKSNSLRSIDARKRKLDGPSLHMSL
jgi:hypothetical protein